ncbi:outer membrane protein [Jannaschia sp. LMIT008]|uniref:outer membrane protein n=1 Tax=Jannaschia maritima TaxID=3032585 RepID=UPI002810DFC6|nr:outer membrane beta-barrel protein [Jannaschia sp. LMIT008]
MNLHHLSTAAVVVVASTSPVLAQKFGPVAPEPVIVTPAVPAPSFAGAYLGGSFGFAGVDGDNIDGDVDGDGDDDDDDDTNSALFDLSDEAVGYGVHAGYNFQTGNVVWGPELAIFGGDVEVGTSTGLSSVDLDRGVRVALRGGIVRGANHFYGLLGAVRMDFDSTSPLGTSSGDGTGFAAGFGIERLVTPSVVVGVQYTLHSVDDVTFDDFGDGSEVDVDYRVLELRASYKF